MPLTSKTIYIAQRTSDGTMWEEKYISGSNLIIQTDATGNIVGLITLPTGSVMDSSSYSITSSYALNSLSASYAVTASYALNGGGSSSYALTASYVENSQTASYSLFSITASFAQNFNPSATASYAIMSATASHLIGTASWANNAVTASYVAQVVSASYALTASFASNVSTPTWDSVTSKPTVFSASAQVDYTGIQNKPTTIETASYVVQAISASYSVTASYASNVTVPTWDSVTSKPTVFSASAQVDYTGIQNKPTTIETASYVLQAVSASYALTASYTTTAQTASALISTGNYTVNKLTASENIIATEVTATRHNIGSAGFINDGSSVYISGGTVVTPTFTIFTVPTPATGSDTLLSLFGSDTFLSATGSSDADTVVMFVSNTWRSYWYDGTNWRRIALGSPVSDAVVVPNDFNYVSVNRKTTGKVIRFPNRIANLDMSIDGYRNVTIRPEGTGSVFIPRDLLSYGNILTSGAVSVGKATPPNAKLDVYGNAVITGSLIVTVGVTGSLSGTASWALNAVTASYVTLAQTASYVTLAQTASALISTGNYSANILNLRGINPTLYINRADTVGSNAIALQTALANEWAIGQTLLQPTSKDLEFVSYELGDIAFKISSATGDATTFGKVGVGKATPNAKLDVSGSVIITGSLAVTGNVGFYNTTPIAKPEVTGSTAGNVALQSLLVQLAALGIITNSTT